MIIPDRKIQIIDVSAIIYSTKKLLLPESMAFPSEILMKCSAIPTPVWYGNNHFWLLKEEKY